MILLLCLLPVALPAADWVELKNDFIRVKVEQESGRYILQTVMGNPDNPRDDRKYLSYNDSPPTSFTTIAFDGGKKVYKFGSSSGKLIKKPTVENGTLVTIWSIKDCWITQTLNFTNSPTTRRADSVKIAYKVVNRSDKVQKIGIRILIDTSLGEADGTPYFLPGIGTVDDEKEFVGANIPAYWYSFDNLKRPRVRSMGTTKGKQVTTPDRLVFASWKKLDSNPWKYEVNEGSSFRRSLLGARDSAVALYFNTKECSPGREMEASTLYGMFGTARYSGKVVDLVLGGSSQTTSGEAFTISLNIRNISRLDLTTCTVRLNMPGNIIQSIPDSEGKYSKEIQKFEDFDSGDYKNIIWHFKAKAGVKGEYPYSVLVTGTHNKKVYAATAKRTLLINQAVTNILDQMPTADLGSLEQNRTNIITNRVPVVSNITPRLPLTNKKPLVIQMPGDFPARRVAPPVTVAPAAKVMVQVVTNPPIIIVTTNRIYIKAVTNLEVTNAGMTNTGATDIRKPRSGDRGVGKGASQGKILLTPTEQKEMLSLEKSTAILGKRINDYRTGRSSNYTDAEYRRDQRLYKTQLKRLKQLQDRLKKQK